MHSIQHLGCNVAEWNKTDCKRELVHDKVLINGIFPIVFAHFSGNWSEEIINGKDKMLLSFYRIYKERLEKYKSFYPKVKTEFTMVSERKIDYVRSIFLNLFMIEKKK